MDIIAHEMKTRAREIQEERISALEIQLIKYRDNRTPLLVKLVTGEELSGTVQWYSDSILGLIRVDNSEVTVFLNAVAYFTSAL